MRFWALVEEGGGGEEEPSSRKERESRSRNGSEKGKIVDPTHLRASLAHVRNRSTGISVSSPEDSTPGMQ